LEQHHAEIEAAGLKAVAVGLGEPKHAQRYCPALAPRLTCLVGRGASAHTAYGLRPGGLSQLAGPQVAAAALRAAVHGNWQGAATGDTTVLGGTFVVGTDGLVRAACYDRHAGDHPDLARLLAQFRREVAAS
jgi:hypothetical protein